MTADQPQEYIITEEQLGELMIEYVNRPLPVNQYIARSKLGDDIRSRPLASHSQQEPEQKFIDNAITFACEKHDAAIRKEERERFANDIAQWIQKHSRYENAPRNLKVVSTKPLLDFIQSLRAGDEK